MLNQVNVKFGADVSGLRTGVEQSKRMLGGLKSAAAGVAGVVAAIVGSGLVAGARQIISEFARIQDLADRFGISAEQMQKLGFIAKQNGTDIESMAMALQRSNIAASKAAEGNEALAKSFADLGLNATEFLSLSGTDQLAALAGGFQNAQSEAEGFAAVIAIAGRGGGELIPTLRGGAEGVKEMADSFDALSNESVKAFARADDSVERLAASFKVLIAGPLADFLEWFEKAAIKSTAFGKSIINDWVTIGKIIKGVVTGDTDAFKGAMADNELFRRGIEMEKEKKLKDIEDSKTQGPPTDRPFTEPFVNPFQDALDDLEKNGAKDAMEAAYEKNNDAAKKAFDDFLDASEELAGLKKKRSEMGITSPVVSSSLASIGLGGGVFGGNGNPMIAKLDKQIEYASKQLTELQNIKGLAAPELMR